jgi:hypothetical protein
MLYAAVWAGSVLMGDDDEIHLHGTYVSHWHMDDAFCDRMLKAMEAGLENAPIGVVTTPGTQNPKYILSEPWPLDSSSLADM